MAQDPNQRLREWYASLLGQSMLGAIRGAVEELLLETYGFHAVQVGLLAEDGDLLAESDLIHPVLLDATPWHPRVGLVAQATDLPFATRGLDLILLLHTLELSPDPYRLLREVDRVLSDDGYLIIIGFNPLSLWGLTRVLLRWRDRPPWNARFYSMARVQDWLRLLGYRTLRRESHFYAPPLQHQGALRRLAALEGLRRLLPRCGGVYLLKARKQTVPLTPVRSRWLTRTGLVPGGLARPTHRV